MVEEKDLGDFTFVGFGEDDKPVNATMTVSNNGHSVVVGVDGDYHVSGAGLGTTAYKAVQFHFHWGSVNSQGSEHTIDGKAYPGELHIVCYNTSYPNFFSALFNEDGLTVLGFFLEIQTVDNPALTQLFDVISSIQFDEEEEDLSMPVVFNNFLPSDLSSYYRYSGSLTTPPCYEIVTWNVFTEPIMVSEAQLNALRRQYANKHNAADNITLTDTYRPVQPVNNRTVYMTDPNAVTDHMTTLSPNQDNINTENVNTPTPSYVNTPTPSSAPCQFASTSLVALVISKVLASVLDD
ncbi:carbonic anhydrase 2-like isoform X2 [Patiria miniata]|nr:carbonic anhydrase 2-like isoform X2 [Patiria miniata]